MIMKLQDHCVVVTGAGSGIGRACAIKCAEEGADVVVADINEKAAEETVRQIQDAGGNAFACKADVADPSCVARLVEVTIGKYGKINTLINNAAIQVNKTIEDTSFEDWNAQMAVNVGGVFLCSKLFLPHLKVTGGSIVSMSSVNGYFAEPSCAGYCATKAAIIGLTKAMAIDHGHEGIRVNCIAPGFIVTDMSAKALNDDGERKQKVMSRTPMGYMGDPADIASAALYLANDEAKYVTGIVLPVDGGNSIGF